jgi:DNA-binding NarL/FixJ family response regulator
MSGHSQSHPSKIRLLIVSCNRLDSEMLSAQFCACTDFCAKCAAPDIGAITNAMRECRPDCLLLDANLLGREAEMSLASWSRELGGVPILLLDDDINFGHLTAVLESSSIGYFTHATSFAELADGVRRLAKGERAFGPKVQKRIEDSSHGWRLRQDQPHSPFDRLTRRELEIARLIAEGNSVRQCAQALNLSPSTIDNHKTRFMKKLGVHKAHELTRLAVLEGIIHM